MPRPGFVPLCHLHYGRLWDGFVWPDGTVPPDAAPPEWGNGEVEGDEVCDASRVVLVFSDWSGSAGASVRAHPFGADGLPLQHHYGSDQELMVNTTFWNAQLTPTVCITEPSFLTAWEDQSGQDPDESGSAIRYRLLPAP